MLETLLNPKKAQRQPFELFFVGIFYVFLSIVLSNWIFLESDVFAPYASMLVITFVVMFSIPFVYNTFRIEEEKNIYESETFLQKHGRAILTLVWLFLGFLVAFSLAYLLLPQNVVATNFKAQLEQYCTINVPCNVGQCVKEYGMSKITASAFFPRRFSDILLNNVYVLIFCMIFSLAFGAGAIFILAWNASVIATAIGIFSGDIVKLPIAFARYMIHGLPEIASYFIGALAGGIISVAIIRHDFKEERFWSIVKDSMNLIILAFIVLIIAAFIEVYITPALF